MNVMHENHNVKRISHYGLKNLTTWKMCIITWLKFDGIHIFFKKSNSTLYAP
jgi:hypothetical protein